MNPNEIKIMVGDRVVISRPTSTQRFAPRIDKFATATAVRAKSFDAGGLCFRYDGREWNGHNRVRLVLPDETGEANLLPVTPAEATRAERAKEDAVLAFLLSSRHETEWLKLGLEELRRIAALHGIMAMRVDTLESLTATPPD